MKKSTLLFCLFIFSFQLYSQHYVSNDAQWVYNFNGFWGQGITRITYEQDVLIEDRLVKQFGRYHSYFLWDLPDTNHVRNGSLYLYENNGIVERSLNGAWFDTLYNFKATIGEQWNSYQERRFAGNVVKYDTTITTVTDTFHQTISGRSFFCQELNLERHNYTGYVYTYTDTIYEFLGSLNYYIDPYDAGSRAVDAGEGGPLRCFSNNGIGVIPISSGFFPYECVELATSVEEEILSNNLRIYPNPALHSVYIENDLNEEIPVVIHDLIGRKLKEVYITPGKSEIDILSFGSGLYIISSEGQIISRILKN